MKPVQVRRYFGKDPRCHICGFKIPIGIVNKKHPLFGTIDHILPRSRGGTDSGANRRPAHRTCNEIKADMEITEDLRLQCRLAIARFVDPMSSIDRTYRIDRNSGNVIAVDPGTGRDLGKIKLNYKLRVGVMTEKQVEEAGNE